MIEHTDQMHRTIRCVERPQRIVSLVPSQTELLYDLGLGDRVVGITKFCIHPNEWYQNKTRVGGTKNIDVEKIKALEPDLIIANKEENTKKDIEAISEFFPVWISDIITLQGALNMIRQIGSITDCKDQAEHLLRKIETGFSVKPKSTNLNCLYAIWKDPWMFAGQNVFINEMLGFLGVQNLLSNEEVLKAINPHNTRYPAIKESDLKSLEPDLIFLSSEPFPFKENHIQELQALFPNAKIHLVDGEMFTWYGSRLQYAPDYLNKLNHSIQK